MHRKNNSLFTLDHIENKTPLKNAIRFLENDPNFSRCCVFFKEIFTRRLFLEKILPTAFEKCEDKSLKKCAKKVSELTSRNLIEKLTELNDGPAPLETERVRWFVHKIGALIFKIASRGAQISFNEFKQKLANPYVWADQEIICLISHLYDYDLYFPDHVDHA